MANTPVVFDFTPHSVRRAQKRGGSTFRGQAENIIVTQVHGLPVGTTLAVGTIPSEAAALIEFVGISADTLLTLKSLNGVSVTMTPNVAAAAISYLAANWLLWYHYNSGNEAAALAANDQWEALGRYIYLSGRFTEEEIAAVAWYVD